MTKHAGNIEGMPAASHRFAYVDGGDCVFFARASGEFPKIILAAGDAEEAFHFTMRAFNLADKYQTPVVVIVDKQVCESHYSVEPFNYSNYKAETGKFTAKKQAGYQRYALSADGISVRSIPGSGNHVVVNSDEHNEAGYSNEEARNRIEQMKKRMQKLETCAKKDMPAPQFFGPKNADLTIVSWGSNKGVILEAMKNFTNVNFLYLTWISPFPAYEIKKVLSKARSALNIECNFSAQMGGIIRERTGVEIKNNLLKYDGRPFFPEEITAQIKKFYPSKIICPLLDDLKTQTRAMVSGMREFWYLDRF